MANKPEEANPILQVKLKQLRIACGRTGSVLESNKNTAICRQIESLKALSADVEKSRMKVESLKIKENEVEETITEWNRTIEEDDEIQRMEEWRESCQQEMKYDGEATRSKNETGIGTSSAIKSGNIVLGSKCETSGSKTSQVSDNKI